ncbi:hypothetical protein HO173_007072 [Letharia columbiana]|uniref:Uncharacterized protein n=1 Tax=Letharia columbiana TaxID=112416 RepID=A0A8H6L435_9LECA|nr:uncharacterized protein HO173_007072 [Letharia columbiana]KAF6234852.1 hypothetical protein HO173_007072 [Letharia columbiana]
MVIVVGKHIRWFAPHDAKTGAAGGFGIDYTEVISMDYAFVEATPDAGATDPVAELILRITDGQQTLIYDRHSGKLDAARS